MRARIPVLTAVSAPPYWRLTWPASPATLLAFLRGDSKMSAVVRTASRTEREHNVRTPVCQPPANDGPNTLHRFVSADTRLTIFGGVDSELSFARPNGIATIIASLV